VNAADLKSVKLLAEFTAEDREALAELVDERRLDTGRRVFSEGEEAESLVMILEGSVRVEDREGEIEGLLLEGDSLGGVALVRPGPRAATAVCEDACRLVSLDRSGYRRLADDHPRTAIRLIEAILQAFAADVREAIEDAAL